MALSMYGKTRAYYSVGKRKEKEDMDYLPEVFKEKYDLVVDSQEGKAILTENVTEGNVYWVN